MKHCDKSGYRDPRLIRTHRARDAWISPAGDRSERIQDREQVLPPRVAQVDMRVAGALRFAGVGANCGICRVGIR